MKRILCFIVLFTIVFSAASSFFTVTPSALTTENLSVSRMINVVYDDSNSMLLQGRLWWCYAKYSLEIFSAMMQEKDQMNVYFMSQFRSSTNAAPIISGLSGRLSDQLNNIRKIHNTVTRTSGTPFNSISTAFRDLKSVPSSYTEKWLVVITDGDRFDKNETKADLDSLCGDAIRSGINVVYLAIGSDLTPTANENNGIFVKKADGNAPNGTDGILSKVTEISQIIFQRPQLRKVASGKITFDVPVSEVIVLAQGKNVTIGDIPGMTKYSASVIMSDTDADKATTNNDYKNQVRVEALNGTIATFIPSNGMYVKEGTYDFNISAQEYTVYYKPKLDVELNLIDKNGNVMTSYYIPKGSYTLDYGLTYPEGHEKHGEKISSSMFEVAYKLTCSVNGNPRSINGFSVDLTEGNTEITVEAKYLIFISQSTTNKFVVEDFTVNELGLEIEYLQQDYKLSTLEKENDGFKVRVTRNGESIPPSEWESFVLDCSANRLGIRAEKNNDSTFSVYPAYNNGSKKDTAVGEGIPIKVTVSTSNDHRKTDEGTVTATINIDDDISAADITITIDPQDEEYGNKGFSEQDPVRTFSLKWRGQDLTKEQYEALTVFAEIENDCLSAEAKLDPYVQGKPVTGTVGFRTIKTNTGEEPDPQNIKSSEFKIDARMDREGEISRGEATDTLKIKDTRSFWERFISWLIRWWWLVALILFLFAYVFFKKWLPIKIKGVVNAITDVPRTFKPYLGGNSSALKTWLTVLVPFHPVMTTLKISGGNISFKLKVKGAGGGNGKVTTIPKGLPRGRFIDGMPDRKELNFNSSTIETEEGETLFTFGQ